MTKGVWKLQEVRDQILASRWITYNISRDPGTLWAMGCNGSGQLGNTASALANVSSPVQLPGTQWSCGETGGYHSLALKSDNTLWTWGRNTGGQLGDNTSISKSSPIQIPGTTWSLLCAGFGHSIGLKSDNTLWVWGCNNFGQQGQNDRVDRSSPIQIPGTAWTNIDSGTFTMFGVKSDGTLWSVGRNFNGELGASLAGGYSNFARSSPVQIAGTAWVSVHSGELFSLARKTDGTLWSWGFNGNNYQGGQLGDNTRGYLAQNPKSSPVQVPGNTWTSAAAGAFISVALKSDGTLWTWGGNANGELGTNNNRNGESSPVQVPGTSWCLVSACRYTVHAMKTDNTLWSWGKSVFGQRGDNSIVTASSPIQIPGTSWVAVSDGRYHAIARKV